jgi:primosomal protein N' (replication factor Y)
LLECLMLEASGFSHPPFQSAPAVDPAPPALADVALPRHLHRVFTYLVPTHLQVLLQVGSRVQVPFGHTTLEGTVVALHRGNGPEACSPSRRSTSPFRLREIGAVVNDSDSETPPDLLTLSRLVSEYYLAPWGQCMRLILPPARPLNKIPSRYQLTDTGHDLLRAPESLNRLSLPCQVLLKRLHSRPRGLSFGTLRRGAERSLSRDLALLKRRKLLVETAPDEKSTSRVALPSIQARVADTTPGGTFTDGLKTWQHRSAIETAWSTSVLAAIGAGRPMRFLLQGPPTRRVAAILETVDAALKQQRRVILILPEISKAETLAAVARIRWGDQVELFHSGLSAALRHERWQRLRSGSITVAVGTRSVVFAPLSSIGLIYVDDEDNSSLKEETEPRYHARDVAWMRAQLSAAVVVLGSAHPSLETMQVFAPGTRQGSHSSAPQTCAVEEVDPEESPDIHLVNLRDTPYGTVLSEPMLAGIRAALEARTGIILFLNRKGFAPALVCRDCGNSPRCPQCSVALTFYKQAGRLACHYCGASRSLPDTCPTCHAVRLQPGGVGTEAVEEWTRRLFPQARIERVDSETSSNARKASSVRRRFMAGELDVLIGTQMLSQGDPALSAGFVGLTQADAGLHLPDFRAGEHTYRALMNVIALARPKRTGGRVVLQTFLPTHYVIQAVAAQDPTLFYRQELAFRQALAYPPYTDLISLRVSGASPDRTKQAADDWVAQLKAMGQPSLTVWGPIPSAVARLREKYRWQVIVRSPEAEVARRSVQSTLTDLETRGRRSGIKFEVDVDPISTL